MTSRDAAQPQYRHNRRCRAIVVPRATPQGTLNEAYADGHHEMCNRFVGSAHCWLFGGSDDVVSASRSPRVVPSQRYGRFSFASWRSWHIVGGRRICRAGWSRCRTNPLADRAAGSSNSMTPDEALCTAFERVLHNPQFLAKADKWDLRSSTAAASTCRRWCSGSTPRRRP